jgi:hypothetical protein
MEMGGRQRKALEALLDLSGLSHGDETAIVTDVDETVLLEDWAEEGVEDDRGAGVGDDARLLVQLLGEEVDTEITMLAGLRRGGDADDLARAVLKDHEIANADVVAGDGEGGSLRGMHRGDVRGLVWVGVLSLCVRGIGNRSMVVGVVLGSVVVIVVVVLRHLGGFV